MDDIPSLIISDAVLPDQFWPDQPLAPSRVDRFLVAVLENGINEAIGTAGKSSTRSRRRHKEAISWIATRDDDSLCAFETLCGQIGINPDYLRRGITQLIQDICNGRAKSKRIRLKGNTFQRRNLETST